MELALHMGTVPGGHTVVSPGDVRELLAVYNVAGPEAEALVALAREARQRGWWRQYSEVLPTWFETYLGLEAEASRLCIFELGAVPDLLQTQDYTTAVFDANPQPRTPDEQAMVVSLWHTRQNRLTGDTAIELDTVIFLDTLREVGTYRLAYEQLRAAALEPQDSVEFIGRLAGELPPP